MPTLENIYYEEQGSGPVLFLVHGFCLDHQIWDKQVKALQEQYRIICIDVPGFGKSPLLDKPSFALEDIAEQIIRFHHALGLEEVIYVGHSLGGYLGLALAQSFPQIVKGLALINSSALADDEEKRASRERVNAFVAKSGVEPFIRQFVPELFYQKGRPRLSQVLEEVVYIASQTNSLSLIRTNQAMARRPSYEKFLKNIPVPVLFLIGRDDHLIPFALYQAQVHWPPKVSVHILNQTGHMAMLERPQVSSLLIDTFARSCEIQE